MKLITVTNLHKKRIIVVATVTMLVALVVLLALYALKENINLFYTPSNIYESKSIPRTVKLGGMIVTGSVSYEDELGVTFSLTDMSATTKIHYRGILPDLFREGQGIVTEGSLREDGLFVATKVFAKHDESYMPPNLSGDKRVT